MIDEMYITLLGIGNDILIWRLEKERGKKRWKRRNNDAILELSIYLFLLLFSLLDLDLQSSDFRL